MVGKAAGEAPALQLVFRAVLVRRPLRLPQLSADFVAILSHEPASHGSGFMVKREQKENRA